MSELFNNVKVGDTVHYSTPQGQYGKGKVVIKHESGSHVVINRGKGQPQVVNDKNYVKHERGGKVVGALLSKLAAHDKYLKGVAATKASNAVAKAVSPYKKVGDPQMNASKAFGWTKTNEMRNPSGPYGGHPYDWDPELRKAIFAGMAKKNGKSKGPKDTGRDYKPNKLGPPPRRGTTSESIIGGVVGLAIGAAGAYGAAKNTPLTGKKATVKNYLKNFGKGMVGVGLRNKKNVKEDAAEAEGQAARVTKTKHKKKGKLHELTTATLASYVSKSIGDEKKQKQMADMARRIHTPERSAYFVDKATAKAAKRHAGAKLAMKKIAKAYEETVVEGESAAKARAGERSWTSDLADKSPNLSKGAGKIQPGYHYRTGGKTVSVHDHPQDALSAYKKGGSVGRIVHVKEGVETDVTTQILSEAKVKDVAQRIVLAKKAKGNKHVDTEPKLDIVDKGTHGPIQASDEGGHNA